MSEVQPGYETILRRSKRLAEVKPDIVSYEEIGKSETGGRPIPCLRIGDFSRDLPLLFVTGGTHGSEENGRATAMALAEWLACAGTVAGFEDGSAFVRKLNVVVIPCVNPDGSILNTYHNGADKNINKSYRYQDASTTAEGRAVEALAEDLLPDCIVDCHGLAGGAMGDSQYVHPSLLSSGMSLEYGLRASAEMNAAAWALGFPQRHPHIRPLNKAGDGLPPKIAGETNALAFVIETTEHYRPLDSSVRSGLARLKALIDIGTRENELQPYPGFPCDVITGGPMFALLAYGSTYRQRRLNRAKTMAAILESGMCQFNRELADQGDVATITLSFDEKSKTFPEGIVITVALEKDVVKTVTNVEFVLPDGTISALKRLEADGNLKTNSPNGYTLQTDQYGIQNVRAYIGQSPKVGKNELKIAFRRGAEAYDPIDG